MFVIQNPDESYSKKKLRTCSEKIISEYRGGFRTGRSTTEQLIDRIDGNILYKVMLDFKIPWDAETDNRQHRIKVTVKY